MMNTQTKLLDGKIVASTITTKIKASINSLREKKKKIPSLTVILVGNDPASHIYVKNKEKTSNAIGIESKVLKLPDSIKEDDLTKIINGLNTDKSIDGILVQLPLPKHIRTQAIIEAIDPRKDVDGLHPYNLGRLMSGNINLAPCTPLGIIEILKHYGYILKGTSTVIV